MGGSLGHCQVASYTSIRDTPDCAEQYCKPRCARKVKFTSDGFVQIQGMTEVQQYPNGREKNHSEQVRRKGQLTCKTNQLDLHLVPSQSPPFWCSPSPSTVPCYRRWLTFRQRFHHCWRIHWMMGRPQLTTPSLPYR